MMKDLLLSIPYVDLLPDWLVLTVANVILIVLIGVNILQRKRLASARIRSAHESRRP